MRHYFFITLFLLFIAPPVSAKTVDIRVGIEKGWISAIVVGKGGHSESSILLKLKNLRKRKIEIYIPAGLVFFSTDSTAQDLIIVQERLLVLTKKEKRSFSLRAMCIQASNSSPVKGSAFQIGEVAKDDLLALVEHINEKNLYRKYGQYAIWSVTDQKRVENIASPELAVFTAKLLGVDVPKYHIIHDRRGTAGQRAFVNSPAIIKGVFKYKMKKEEVVSFGLYNEAGEIKYTAFENQVQKRGKHRFSFQFKVRNIPPGKYYARLIGEAGQIKELVVEF